MRGRRFALVLSLAAVALLAATTPALAQDSSDKVDKADRDRSGDDDDDDDDGDGDDDDDASKGKGKGKDADRDRPARGSRAARNRARTLFKRGQALIRVQQYDDGIAAIEEAYELDPRIDHLYNLGAAHHIKGDKRKALDYYQKVIEAGKPNSLVRLATRFARELEQEIEAEDAASARVKAAEEAARKGAEQAAAARKARKDAAQARARLKKLNDAYVVSRKRATEARAERDAWRTVAGERGGGRGKRFLGTTFMLLGGAALGGAGAYFLVASDADSKNEDLGPGDPGFEPGLEDIGDQASDRMLVLAIAGGAVTTLGIVIYVLGERDVHKPGDPDVGNVAVTPILSPNSAGVQVISRF